MPFVTVNNSTIEENSNRLKLNRNSFYDNNNYHINISQNLPMDKYLNYSSIVDNKINKENKNKITRKNKIDQEKLRANLFEVNSQNNNSINNEYNFHAKFISSNNLDNNINKSKTNRSNLNQYYFKENNNNNHSNITDNYISKEKNKKRKQNPPLNKNPKKLNILSLIQENNRKIKTNIRGKNNISTYINSINNKSFNNNKNDYLTIDQILYPENDKLFSNEKFDNFDDINTIVKRISRK